MTRDVPFSRMVENWVRFATSHSDVCDLYFSIVYSPTLLPDAAFFMLAQVAEEYHRELHPGTEIPETEYQQRCTDILASVPRQYASWVREKLKYTNERSFRKRVRELVHLDSEALQPFLGKATTFVNDVVNTRNYMAHRTEELRRKAGSGVGLARLNERLRLVLKATFLRELGCTESERTSIIGRHASLNYFLKPD